MFSKPIAISLSPNTELSDFWQAVKTFFQPWTWTEGKEINKVEKWFCEYFQSNDAVSFNSGRSALFALLKTFGVGEGDEVIIQAFTCVAVADPVIWVGAHPKYVDIDNTLNINPKLLEQCITDKTKAIIVQHTFGIPADIQTIKKITQKHQIILIEDCAHGIGASINNKKIGTFGDAAFFSFGRDKIISSVFGGIAMINSKFKIQNSKLREMQNKLSYPKISWIIQQLLHPITFTLILPFYNLYIGKIILIILQKFKLLSFPVEMSEKYGGKPNQYPQKYPNALAQLLLLQLAKLEKYNLKRKKIAEYYHDKLQYLNKITLPPGNNDAVYLRYNLFSTDAKKLISFFRKDHIILGNWYSNIIDPRGVDYAKVGYKPGSCLRAEEAARLSVNLPTYIRLSQIDLDRIVKYIYCFYGN